MSERQIIGRAEAKAQGLKTYFTGKPCKNGQIAERRLDGTCTCAICKARHAAQQCAYYAANKDKVRAHYAANTDKIAELRRAHYAVNKDKVAERKRAYYAANKGEVAERNRAYYEANRSKLAGQKRAYRQANPEKFRAYVQANPEKFRAQAAKRRATKLQATPSWFDEFDQLAMEEAHDLARLREEATGAPWHVDHMLPLQGRTVCGLHVANNIQVIPASLNIAKGNKPWLTEEGDWRRFTL